MRKTFYLFLAILSIIFVSCVEDDKFSSDPNLKLEFSPDTIRFDTVFTTIGSTTKQFKIYNRNDNSLRIESIKLMHPEQSGFRINIDGDYGDSFSNVEILRKDSLYGFIEITIDPLNQNNSVIIRDSIEFLVNNNTQYLQLEAIGQDVYIWRGKVIDQNTTLTGDKPYLIYDSLVVKETSITQIKPGSKLFFHYNASLKVHGTLKAIGTYQQPIIFRGDRFGYVEDEIPYDNMPSQWGGIIFDSNSFDNELDNVIIKNTNNGVIFEKSVTSKQKATIKNSIFHNSATNGFKATNCKIDATNCQFSNAGKNVLEVNGGKYNFTYCTIANYFRWSSRNGRALHLSNKSISDNSIVPLDECNITNSIVYGTMNNEITLTNGDDDTANTFEYLFSNCLLKSKEDGSNHYTSIIWNKDPLFKYLNTEFNYFYNFELTEKSPAIDQADNSVSTPYDINGRNRPYGSASDMGCFEWQGE